MKQTLALPLALLEMAVFSAGCGSASAGESCDIIAECASPLICCPGGGGEGSTCEAASDCDTCVPAPQLTNVAGSWNWWITSIQADNADCAWDQLQFTVQVEQTGNELTATVTAGGESDGEDIGDRIFGALCGTEFQWREAPGDEIGCWTFNAAGDQFSQHAIAPGFPTFVDVASGARVGMMMPPVLSCSELQQMATNIDFTACPPPP